MTPIGFSLHVASHHSVFKGPGKDEWYIVYHRHPIGATTGNHRVTCIDRLYFEEDGSIRPVKMTFEGVKALFKARKHSKKR